MHNELTGNSLGLIKTPLFDSLRRYCSLPSRSDDKVFRKSIFKHANKGIYAKFCAKYKLNCYESRIGKRKCHQHFARKLFSIH